MKPEQRKSNILAALEQQQKALSIAELRAILGEEYAERSLRRWLLDLVNGNKVARVGKKRATRYQLIKKADNEIFSAASQTSLEQIQQPIFKRAPATYNSTWLESYQPNQDYYLTNALREHLQAEGQRGQAHLAAGTFSRQIHQRLLIDLSYHSSRLEGNTYSLIETENLVINGIESANHLDAEKVMILNHKAAVEHLINNAERLVINYNEICTLHYLLADALILNQHVAKVRKSGVEIRIYSSTYKPLDDPERLQDKLHLLCQKGSVITDPYEQSIFLLAHIAYLQAFFDVNKRTARLSANIPLIKHNLVPLSFNDIDKDDYINAMLAIYELNDIQPLVELYSYSYLRTCQQYDALTEAIGYDEIRVRYRSQRRTMLGYIIREGLVQAAQNNYIEQEVEKHIPSGDQARFRTDLADDLAAMDSSRLAGLGVSEQELVAWLAKHKPA